MRYKLKNSMQIGDKISSLTLLSYMERFSKKGNRLYYGLFKCDCGNEKEIRINHVKCFGIKSCGCGYGCSKSNIKHDVNVGDKFNHLTVLSLDGTNKMGSRVGTFICVCGKIVKSTISKVTSGRPSSCGCIGRNKDTNKVYLYNNYKHNAKMRNISFNLAFDDFCKLIAKNCHYCNCHPNNICKSKSPTFYEDLIYNGIDRVDNNLGYTLDNCVPCCKQCNSAKMANSSLDYIKKCYEVSQNHFYIADKRGVM